MLDAWWYSICVLNTSIRLEITKRRSMSEFSRTMKKHCLWCKKEFSTRRMRQKYCCDECRYKHFHESRLYVRGDEWVQLQEFKESRLHVDSNDIQ